MLGGGQQFTSLKSALQQNYSWGQEEGKKGSVQWVYIFHIFKPCLLTTFFS